MANCVEHYFFSFFFKMLFLFAWNCDEIITLPGALILIIYNLGNNECHTQARDTAQPPLCHYWILTELLELTKMSKLFPYWRGLVFWQVGFPAQFPWAQVKLLIWRSGEWKGSMILQLPVIHEIKQKEPLKWEWISSPLGEIRGD